MAAQAAEELRRLWTSLSDADREAAESALVTLAKRVADPTVIKFIMRAHELLPDALVGFMRSEDGRVDVRARPAFLALQVAAALTAENLPINKQANGASLLSAATGLLAHPARAVVAEAARAFSLLQPWVPSNDPGYDAAISIALANLIEAVKVVGSGPKVEPPVSTALAYAIDAVASARRLSPPEALGFLQWASAVFENTDNASALLIVPRLLPLVEPQRPAYLGFFGWCAGAVQRAAAKNSGQLTWPLVSFLAPVAWRDNALLRELLSGKALELALAELTKPQATAHEAALASACLAALTWQSQDAKKRVVESPQRDAALRRMLRPELSDEPRRLWVYAAALAERNDDLLRHIVLIVGSVTELLRQGQFTEGCALIEAVSGSKVLAEGLMLMRDAEVAEILATFPEHEVGYAVCTIVARLLHNKLRSPQALLSLLDTAAAERPRAGALRRVCQGLLVQQQQQQQQQQRLVQAQAQAMQVPSQPLQPPLPQALPQQQLRPPAQTSQMLMGRPTQPQPLVPQSSLQSRSFSQQMSAQPARQPVQFGQPPPQLFPQPPFQQQQQQQPFAQPFAQQQPSPLQQQPPQQQPRRGLGDDADANSLLE
jgi:hypothetical protein